MNLATIAPRAEGAAPRPSRRWPAAVDVIELAARSGYTRLPTTDADELASWFTPGAAAGLELYLEAFDTPWG